MKEKSLFLATFTFIVAQLVSSILMFGLFSNQLLSLKALFIPLTFLCLNIVYFKLYEDNIEINRESGKLKNDLTGIFALQIVSILPALYLLNVYESLIFILLFIPCAWAWLYGVYLLECKENGINIFQNTEGVANQEVFEQSQQKNNAEAYVERREMVFEFEKGYKKPE